jgi:hypothetical protein
MCSGESRGDVILVAFAEELGPVKNRTCEKAGKNKVKLVGVLPWLLEIVNVKGSVGWNASKSQHVPL